jgi:hypothetical protein
MRWILLAAAMTLVACQKPVETPAETATAPSDEEILLPPVSGPTVDEFQSGSLSEEDRRACEAKGGAVVQAGRLGIYRCITPFADAGEICRDGDDCFGRCLMTGDADPAASPGTQSGQCERDDNPFGCFTEIEDGSISQAICVD